MKTIPRAFLCHATEDKEIARPLAEELQRNGIDTSYDEWEIGPGDSLPQKIGEGIGDCTHFIVLLTPISIEKPWVKAEMDVGLVRNIKGKCKFIPLRCGLDFSTDFLHSWRQSMLLHSMVITTMRAISRN